MKIVSQKMADACISAYQKKCSLSTRPETTHVSFDSKKLLKWLQDVAPRSAQIQVKFGIYTPENAPAKNLSGRTTVFFCAVDEDGKPVTDEEGKHVTPVNQGTTLP